MKRILIVAVNYNTYELLYQFVDKAIISMKACEEPLSLKIIVADNSSKREEIDTDCYQCVNLEVYKLNNLGYFGGAQYVINKVDNIQDYDYIAISNVDLTIDEFFFTSLCAKKYSHNIGWIAPSIYSLQEKRVKKTMTRPPKWKFVVFRIMYSFPLLYKLYYNTAYRRKREKTQIMEECDIYAGHGAFIILTKSFFNTYKKLNYPIFLFCEENYLAELNRIAGMTVRYDPSLKIFDSEHVSIREIDIKRQCALNYEAVDYILRNFYKD